jgi:hypothetical protein
MCSGWKTSQHPHYLLSKQPCDRGVLCFPQALQFYIPSYLVNRLCYLSDVDAIIFSVVMMHPQRCLFRAVYFHQCVCVLALLSGSSRPWGATSKQCTRLHGRLTPGIWSVEVLTPHWKVKVSHVTCTVIFDYWCGIFGFVAEFSGRLHF